MSGFFESKLLKRTEFESAAKRWRDEKMCFRHNGTMDLQACDRYPRVFFHSGYPLAKKSMIYSKISNGRVFIIMASSSKMWDPCLMFVSDSQAKYDLLITPESSRFQLSQKQYIFN